MDKKKLLEELRRHHHGDLMSLLMSCLRVRSAAGDHQRIAEDICQIAYLRIIQYGGTQGIREPMRYVRTVATRILLKWVADQSRDPISQSTDTSAISDVPVGYAEHDVSELWLVALEKGIERLGSLYRQFIQMNMDGKSARVIADELRISYSCARRILTEARDQLRTEVQNVMQGELK